jgi:HK97 family phage major capsid protein
MPTFEDVVARIRSLNQEIGHLSTLAERGELSGGQQEHLSRIRQQRDHLAEQATEMHERAEERERRSSRVVERIPGTGPTSANPFLASVRDEALSRIEFCQARDGMSSVAADRLDTLVREEDRSGSESRYFCAVSNEDYKTAFGKMLAHPFDAHLRMTPAEAESVRVVAAITQERAMQEGLTTSGGFGVPVFVDPTLMLSSNGAINPLRKLATVKTITTNKWQGVAGSVTASFAAELAEVADGTPTLTGPSITVQKAHCFVPFSIELEGDYTGLVEQLGNAMSDARDVLEAQKFLDGAGPASNEPSGIVGTNGLTAAQQVLTNTTGSTAIADVYSLKEALPPRNLPNGAFTVSPSVLDTFRRVVGGGNTTEPFVVENSMILNRPTSEWSTMVSTTATSGSRVAIFADWQRAYAIVDRIGLQVEIVPHVFGPTQRPIGARGVYAFWRVGAGVLVPNAARYLQVR